MNPGKATMVSFAHEKYGQPLTVDASSFPRWTGIVPDGEPHVLDFHEFLVISRGEAEVVLGGRVDRITGPSVLFTPPQLVRRVSVIDPLQLQLVVFAPRAIRHGGWAPALKGLAAGAFHVGNQTGITPLGAIATLMAAEVAAIKPDSGLMMDALLAQFLVTLGRARGARAADQPILAARFERLLERQFHRHHAVAAYSDALCVSADHLSAVVRSHRGISAKALIDRRLFTEAAQLVATTECSIADIALRLGFEEPAHFARFFRRMCGLSPRRFRAAR